MIGRLNHVAIAVPDIKSAMAVYLDALGAPASDPVAQPAHGVTTVFIELPNTKIELLEPLGEKSPIASFLERNSAGGIHHICYEVADIAEARAHGDLSKNAEYHAAKEQHGHNEGRIKELEAILALADIIDVSKITGDTVKFGATVTFIDENTEQEKTYQIVGDPEADAERSHPAVLTHPETGRRDRPATAPTN